MEKASQVRAILDNPGRLAVTSPLKMVDLDAGDSVKLNTTLPATLERRVQAHMRRRGVSKASVVRNALDQYLRAHERDPATARDQEEVQSALDSVVETGRVVEQTFSKLRGIVGRIRGE